MAPKSLPHKISVPGLNALFGGTGFSRADETPEPPPVPPPEPPVSTWGGPPPAASLPPLPPPLAPPVLQAEAVPLPRLTAVAPVPEAQEASRAKRRHSKPVRVTQPESKGHPKGRHTLVIGEDVLDDLSLLAWAENMSVSAIAREAFDAYLARRKGVIEQARKLRESFDEPREAV